MNKIKVLIVDDSALMRKLLSEILASDSQIEVVGTASDPYIAREKIKLLNPDVLTLDVEMPRMDGVTFLRNLMRLRPMPVVMVSSLTERGAEVTLEALELGATDFVTKPKVDLAHSFNNYAEEVLAKVKTAARAQVRAYTGNSSSKPVSTVEIIPALASQRDATRQLKTTDKIVAIGASTGGTEAIKEILARFPASTPGTVITQHIPELFSGAFAKRMNSVSAMNVAEAEDGMQILPGHAYIAPGNRHLTVVRSGARYLCRLHDGPPVNQHRPSVDELFRSVAQNVGINALGVILTGMGNDGAAGMKAMHDVGSPTIAQDEKTSVVWGMPGEAVKHGGVDRMLPLLSIADEVLKLLDGAD